MKFRFDKTHVDTIEDLQMNQRRGTDNDEI